MTCSEYWFYSYIYIQYNILIFSVFILFLTVSTFNQARNLIRTIICALVHHNQDDYAVF